MNTVGIFAGRGDVILAMLLAMIFGAWLCYLIGGMFHKWQRKRLEKRVRELEQALRRLGQDK